MRGDDIPSFEMFYAQLPKSVFSEILVDLQAFAWQYGPLSRHNGVSDRARFLSAYFNKTVALFSGLLFNRPEEILEGKMTTKNCIEYQFRTCGGITVIFIEVKLSIGGETERLNYYAQVIAECDGEFKMTIIKTLD
jgi:hypothetical protein